MRCERENADMVIVGPMLVTFGGGALSDNLLSIAERVVKNRFGHETL